MEESNHPAFDHTFIFATQDTGEGVDRGDLSWNEEVFTWLKYIPNPGKVIGCLSFSGAIDMRNFTQHANAIVYNVPSGQRYAEGMMNILFGKVNPSGKLTYTMPNTWAEMNFTRNQWPGID